MKGRLMDYAIGALFSLFFVALVVALFSVGSDMGRAQASIDAFERKCRAKNMEPALIMDSRQRRCVEK